MSGGAALASELELIAAQSWPAARKGRLGAWRLFASAGYSGRINACWTLGDSGLSQAASVDHAEAWYAARGLPPLFKIIEGAAPSLETELAARGYEPRTTTLVATADIRGESDPRVDISDSADGRFAQVFAEAQGQDQEDARERLGALSRMPRPRFFAVADDKGPAAIGACAARGPWAGLFAMRTLVGHRRRGLARAILETLLSTASAAGALRAFLQVEAENAPARELYGAAGFAEAYRYRFWTRRPGG